MKSILISKFLNTFLKKDIEVLYFDYPIDEYIVNDISEFIAKKFQAITKAGVELKDEDKDMVK